MENSFFTRRLAFVSFMSLTSFIFAADDRIAKLEAKFEEVDKKLKSKRASVFICFNMREERHLDVSDCRRASNWLDNCRWDLNHECLAFDRAKFLKDFECLPRIIDRIRTIRHDINKIKVVLEEDSAECVCKLPVLN